MSDALSFAEVDGQHVELLPARTVLGVLDILGAGDGNGGAGGTGTQETVTQGSGAESNANQDVDGGAGTGGAVNALQSLLS